jgi:hypothetical protein
MISNAASILMWIAKDLNVYQDEYFNRRALQQIRR